MGLDDTVGPVAPAMSPTNNHGMYAGANNIIISGGTHTMVNGPSYTFNSVPITTNDRQWIEDLRRHTSTGAFHDSRERYDAPKCHPRTRVAVIKEIMDWVKDTNRVEQFLWIYGPAGSGKSSIAQTIAELCEKEGTLASDYFFSRNVPGRNTETNLIPSLACQLATTIPRIGVYLKAAIDQDPLVFSRSLPTQLESLILNPLAQLASSSHGGSAQEKPYPYLVIVDGLDECGKSESQRYILSSLCSAMQNPSEHLIFIIASRPEQVIRDAFNGKLRSCTRRLVLDDKYLPNEDIELFLDSKFEEIRQRHPLAKLLPSDWPSPSDMKYLVHKASGQFIYASTVARFIESPRDRPTERLKIIRNLSPPGNNTPFAELDELYKVILRSIEQSKLDQVLAILALILVEVEIDTKYYRNREPQMWHNDPTGSPLFFQTPLGLPQHMEKFLGYEAGDVVLLLSDLHSIVNIPNASLVDEYFARPPAPLRLYHASLGDFLRDKARSGSFFIDTGVYSAEFARLCISHIAPVLESGRKPPMVLENSNDPLFPFASIAFLQLFSTVNSDKILLHALSSFPIDLFHESMYDQCRIYAFIPSLFEWIYKQDIELYKQYTVHYNNYLRRKLSKWFLRADPHSVSVLTALTLKIKADLHSTLSFFEERIYDYNSTGLRQQFLHHSSDNPNSIDDCLCRLVKIVTEPDESGYYWADTSKYVDLSMQLFDRFQWWPWNPSKYSESSVSQRPAYTMINSELEMIALGLFSAALDRIPNEPRLAKHLKDNRVRIFLYFEEKGKDQLDLLIANYITEYLRISEIQAIDLAVDVANNSTRVESPVAGSSADFKKSSVDEHSPDSSQRPRSIDDSSRHTPYTDGTPCPSGTSDASARPVKKRRIF